MHWIPDSNSSQSADDGTREGESEVAGRIETNAETDEGLGLGIVGVEHLTKGIGFSADAFDEGIIFLGVVTHSFEFIPRGAGWWPSADGPPLNRDPLALHGEYALTDATLGLRCG